MISGKVSGKSLLASRPACKVHGTEVVAVQDATPVRPSPGSRGNRKHPNQPRL